MKAVIRTRHMVARRGIAPLSDGSKPPILSAELTGYVVAGVGIGPTLSGL